MFLGIGQNSQIFSLRYSFKSIERSRTDFELCVLYLLNTLKKTALMNNSSSASNASVKRLHAILLRFAREHNLQVTRFMQEKIYDPQKLFRSKRVLSTSIFAGCCNEEA